MEMAPSTAVLLTVDEDGHVAEEKEVAIELVQRGDILKVLPGMKFPVDGMIVKGSTTVDESMLTGESIPVSKVEGDKVFGSTVNQHGNIQMKASHVGTDTALAQIINLVEDAQVNKAEIQAFADTISGFFAPVVIVIALISLAVWLTLSYTGYVPKEWLNPNEDYFMFSLRFCISVVVIACPCALGLATPTAIMVGTGVGAKMGVLIKGGQALENAHRVNAIVFDKTGKIFPSKVKFYALCMFLL